MHINGRHQEVNHLYHRLKKTGTRSIAITACSPGEGVTSVAAALAECALLAGESTLLVDLNLARPGVQSIDFERSLPPSESLPAPQLIHRNQCQESLLGIPVPKGMQVALTLSQPGQLRQHIQRWQQEFDFVVIDAGSMNPKADQPKITPDDKVSAIGDSDGCLDTKLSTPLVQTVPAETIAGACDHCLLVVMSELTSESDIAATMRRLVQQEAKLLGTLLNDRNNPTLLSELLRELQRLPKPLSWLRLKLERWLINLKMLSIEV